MARIVLSGYYGFQNIGDEAVLAGIIASLRGVLKNPDITVLSHTPAAAIQEYGVNAINRWDPRAIGKALHHADLLVSGGGSLFQDVTGTRSLMYYLGVVRLAKLMRKPVVFYAQGIGPVQREWSRRLTAVTANRVDLITVRDEESRAELLEMGVNKPVLVTADPVLSLEPGAVKQNEGRQLLVKHGVDPGGLPLVGVSVRGWKGNRHFPVLAKVLDRLNERGKKIVFIPFHHPDDMEAAWRVKGMMRGPAWVLTGPYSVNGMISLVASLDLVLGMRLHALILAAVVGVPFVGLSYDPKVDRFLTRLGQEAAGQAEDLDEEVIVNQVETVFAQKEDFCIKLADRMIPLREKARETACLVKDLLEKSS